MSIEKEQKYLAQFGWKTTFKKYGTSARWIGCSSVGCEPPEVCKTCLWVKQHYFKFSGSRIKLITTNIEAVWH